MSFQSHMSSIEAGLFRVPSRILSMEKNTLSNVRKMIAKSYQEYPSFIIKIYSFFRNSQKCYS